jgi:hypothetical protein
LGVDWEEFLRRRFFSLMHPNEIGALDPAIADVQLHTHRHRVPEERELFLREIADNRRALAACGLNPERLTHLPAFLPWLAEAGVVSAVTCVPGLASKGQHPLLLPRFIDTGATSDVEFEGWASELRHFLAKSRVDVALRAQPTCTGPPISPHPLRSAGIRATGLSWTWAAGTAGGTARSDWN